MMDYFREMWSKYDQEICMGLAVVLAFIFIVLIVVFVR